MRHLLRLLLAGGLMAGPLAIPAAAVSAEDLVNLKINGLSDDVLVALIESDGSSFRLSAADIIALYKRGLSERVILAMMNAGKRPAAGPLNQPVSKTVEVQRSETGNQDITITGASPAPIYIEQSVVQRVETAPPPEPIIVSVPVAVPIPVLPVLPFRGIEPVYWGFGGRLRPGSWVPPPVIVPDPTPYSAPAVRR